MLCRSSGYLVRRCISVGIMSFNCSRRHRGRLSASCRNDGAETPGRRPPSPGTLGPRPPPPHHLTCTKVQNRGSLRCLLLSCSKANDWRLQKREEIFWNQEPSAPSNYSERQVREGVSGGMEDRTRGPDPWGLDAGKVETLGLGPRSPAGQRGRGGAMGRRGSGVEGRCGEGRGGASGRCLGGALSPWPAAHLRSPR